MKRLSIFAILIIACASAASAQISYAFAARMQHILDSACAKLKVRGATAAVLVPGVGVWTGAWGESHSGVPIEADMQLPIGSNTKTYIAAVLLKMQEEGKIDLDDTIGTWISHPNADGQITIRQMLNHTSGLFSYTEHPAWDDSIFDDFDRIWTMEEMLPFIKAPSFEKGKGFEYSNTNYLFAGIIIEKVLGKPVQQAVREYILQPLGMQHMFYFPQEQPTATVPHGWSARLGTGYEIDLFDEIPGFANTSFFSTAASAGALIGTAEDNVKFWYALQNGDLLSRQSLNEMKQGVKISNGQYYGLGAFMLDKMINGRPVMSHGGTCIGYLNENVIDTVSGISITVLTNGDGVGNDKLPLQVVRPLHRGAHQMPAVSVAEAPEAAQVAVYPNPVHDVLNIDPRGASGLTTVQLYDLAGKQMLAESHAPGAAQIQTGSLPRGMYMLKLTGADGRMLHNGKVQVAH